MKTLTSKIKLFIKSILAINLTGKIIILLLVSLLIYQHFHYKIIVSEREEYFESYLDDLEYNFNDVENAMSDLISKVDDFDYENWSTNVNDVRYYTDELEAQISDFASSITANFSYGGFGRTRIG